MTFQIILKILSVIFICIMLFIIIRHLWSNFYEKIQRPVQWNYLAKTGKINKDLIRLENNYSDKIRLYNFWFQIERIKREKIPGSFAELGVYQGETARIIHILDSSKRLHLFDTFEGFSPEDLKGETGDATAYKQKDFANTCLDKVLKFIDGNKNIVIHEGYFPETTKGLENEIFSFVHIDSDLYNPIKKGCEFFYPRLSAGGVMIIHDYNHHWEGAVKAVNELLKTIPENIIEVPDMYGSVMIIKNKVSL